METQSNQRMEIGGKEMNAERYLKKKSWNPVGSKYLEAVSIEVAFEAVRLAREEVSEEKEKEIQKLIDEGDEKTYMILAKRDDTIREIREWLQNYLKKEKTDNGVIILRFFDDRFFFFFFKERE